MPATSTFTLCFRVFLLQDRKFNQILSYAVPSYDNEISIGISYSEQIIDFYCCSQQVIASIPILIRLLAWYNICLAVDIKNRTITTTKNGRSWKVNLKVENEDEGVLKIQPGGFLLLGQDQDVMGGGTDATQSLSAYLSDFFFMKENLPEGDAERFTSCVFRPNSSLFNFTNIKSDFNLLNETEVIELPSDEFCSQNTSHIVFFPEARNFETAGLLCRTFYGQLPILESEDETRKLVDLSRKYRGSCFAAGSNTIWLGLKYDKINRTSFDYLTKESPTYTNWYHPLQASEDISCTVVLTESGVNSANKGDWKIRPCSRDSCAACFFENIPTIHFRGLCSNSKFDREYGLFGIENGRPTFHGVTYSKVMWVPVSNGTKAKYGYWRLTYLQDPSIYATMTLKKETDNPIGTNDWYVHGDDCGEQAIKLLATACASGMFTCSNGLCINMEKRCNLEMDCEDHTDELGCQVLFIPPGYSNNLPAPRNEDSKPVVVSLSIHIYAFHRLSLIDAELKVEHLLSRRWKDSRLRFRNLKEHNTQNIIENIVEQLWFPEMSFVGEDSCLASFTTMREMSWAKKDSPPQPDSFDLMQDQLFLGSKNPLVMEREFSSSFRCKFRLYNYPFDTQNCSMFFILALVTGEFVITHIDSLEYSGEKHLIEYEVFSITASNVSLKGRSGQRVVVIFKNMYSYYITSTYVPTLLLVIISYLTFWFSPDDFADRIMVSLTSLLVMTSLFAQVSSGLPKTSYLKLIDIWFVFCIIIDFVMIVFLVVINGRTTKVHDMTSAKSRWKSLKMMSQNQVNRLAQVVSIVSIAVFTTAYFSFVAHLLWD